MARWTSLYFVCTMILVVTSCSSIPSTKTARDPASADWDTKYVPDAKAIAMKDGIRTFSLSPQVPALNLGWRIELTDRQHIQPFQSVRFETTTRFPTEMDASAPKSVTVSQWHEQLAEGYKRPPFAMRVKGSEVLMTIWNDRILDEQGIDGDGLVILRFPVDKKSWYRINGCLNFDPVAGVVKVEVRKCSSHDECEKTKSYSYESSPGIGYQSALSYYFKFGAYTTWKFSKQFLVDHFVKSGSVRIVETCSEPNPVAKNF